jgi:hypothetical protein
MAARRFHALDSSAASSRRMARRDTTGDRFPTGGDLP